MHRPSTVLTSLVVVNVVAVCVVALTAIVAGPIDLYLESIAGNNLLDRPGERLAEAAVLVVGILVIPIAYRSVLRGNVWCSQAMTWLYGFAGVALGVYAISVLGNFVVDVVEILLREGLAAFRGPRVLPWVARQLIWPAIAVYLPVAAVLQSRWTGYLRRQDSETTTNSISN